MTQTDVTIRGRTAQRQQRVQELVVLGGPRQKNEEEPPHLQMHQMLRVFFFKHEKWDFTHINPYEKWDWT